MFCDRLHHARRRFIRVIAGFFGGWVDSILSRLTDIFFGIPLLLGGILVLSSFPASDSANLYGRVGKVVPGAGNPGLDIDDPHHALFGDPGAQRRLRDRRRALGASSGRIIRKHVVPNSLAPLIVVATISLGGYIGAEATLSFLGLGLQPPVISWGTMINDAALHPGRAVHALLPAIFLSVAVEFHHARRRRA